MYVKDRDKWWSENNFIRDWNSSLTEQELCAKYGKEWSELRGVAYRMRQGGVAELRERRWVSVVEGSTDGNGVKRRRTNKNYTRWVETNFTRDWNSNMSEEEMCRKYRRRWKTLREVALEIRRQGIIPMKQRRNGTKAPASADKTMTNAMLITGISNEDMNDICKRHNRGVPINIIAQLHGITKYKVKAVLAHKAEELFVQSVNRK